MGWADGAGECWRAAPALAAQVTNLETLWCWAVYRQQTCPLPIKGRSWCSANTCTAHLGMRPGPAAQHQNGDLAGATSGAPPLGDTCSWAHVSTLPKVSIQGIRGILRPVDWSCTQCGPLPAQSQLPILKQCHCHQLALIRTWSTQFLEPTAETCNNNTPCGRTAWQHWQDRHFDSTAILPFSAATY